MKINITSGFNHNNASVILAFLKSPAFMLLGMALIIIEGNGSFYSQTANSASLYSQCKIPNSVSKPSHRFKLSTLTSNP